MKKVAEETISSEQIQLRITTVQLRPDGVLDIRIKPEELFVEQDAIELIEAAGRIGNGKRMANLIRVGKYTTADNPARALSCSQFGSRYKLADAFVISSMPQAIVGNFYLKFNKPCVPTRFFFSEQEAEEWLKQFLD